MIKFSKVKKCLIEKLIVTSKKLANFYKREEHRRLLRNEILMIIKNRISKETAN